MQPSSLVATREGDFFFSGQGADVHMVINFVPAYLACKERMH